MRCVRFPRRCVGNPKVRFPRRGLGFCFRCVWGEPGFTKQVGSGKATHCVAFWAVQQAAVCQIKCPAVLKLGQAVASTKIAAQPLRQVADEAIPVTRPQPPLLLLLNDFRPTSQLATT